MMEYEIAIRYRYYGDIIGNGEQNFDMETNEHTSTIPVEDLYGKGSAFTSAGPAPLVGDILEHPELVWTEDSWNEDKEERAKKRLGQQGAEISKYWVEKYKEKAGMYWHEFYKRNKDHFYKDRHYLHLVFPELIDNIGGSLNLLEVGCGVGNAFLPLLELNDNLNCTAIDFAQSAIDLLRENSLVLANSNRVHCVRCCIVEDELPLLDDSADLVLCMFVLSAIAPEKLQRVLEKIATKMKHGGKILVRDYGR